MERNLRAALFVFEQSAGVLSSETAGIKEEQRRMDVNFGSDFKVPFCRADSETDVVLISSSLEVLAHHSAPDGKEDKSLFFFLFPSLQPGLASSDRLLNIADIRRRKYPLSSKPLYFATHRL
ncbi:hypothetical protein KM043_007163 [Ampulex compressa]|nr:hypothetical protein KM043_007163 [Ampulex compressa]